MIEITGFGKDYGEFTAVESLDLKIEEGEMFGSVSYTHLTLPTIYSV